MELKRCRVQDCIKGQSKIAVWRNNQESICKALTPCVAPHGAKKRASTTDLDKSRDTSSTDIQELSNTSPLIQSFDLPSIGAEKDVHETNQAEEQSQGGAWHAGTGDLFEVTDPRYHDIGLILTLGESNLPCSTNERADIDLALVFKYTHLT
jgi:hypothetical protein